MRRALRGWLAVLVVAGCVGVPATGWAEGSVELGTTVGVTDTARLRIDVLDPTEEEIAWDGNGLAFVFYPDGVTFFGSIAPGSQLAVDPTVGGAYEIELALPQNPGGAWSLAIVDDGGFEQPGRLWSREWILTGSSLAEADALSTSFFARAPGGAADVDSVIEIRFAGLASDHYVISANELGLAPPHGGRSAPDSLAGPIVGTMPLYINPPEASSYARVAPADTTFAFETGTQRCNMIVPGSTTGDFVFESNVIGTYHIVCDVDGGGVADISADVDLQLAGHTTVGPQTVTWDGTDRDGAAIGVGPLACHLVLAVGEVHYVANDMESGYPGVRMFLWADNGTSVGVPMYWNDGLVQASAVEMQNLLFGLETSGPDGLASGGRWDAAEANVNARAWGNFGLAGGGKGDSALLDTYTWADQFVSPAFTLAVVAADTDTDLDTLPDHVEACELGTASDRQDSDDDGVRDDVEAPGGAPINSDTDALIDALDSDSDDDTVEDGDDEHRTDGTRCRDTDMDQCDDCSSGTDDPDADGTDTDSDGQCDKGDFDDDNDGISDTDDTDPTDPTLCTDSDNDQCDDCAIGVDGFDVLADNDPANDGDDNDTDGLCDVGDPDDDNDGVDDDDDDFPFDNFRCRDFDGDTCDDCVSGTSAPNSDGADFEGDGLCDAGDTDDDNDGVADGSDTAPYNGLVCRDVDNDTCNDCSGGFDDTAADGPDNEHDGLCDAGDPDDDNDGVTDQSDEFPFDGTRCRDVDTDTCDDCSSGSDDPARDGADNDGDGQCDLGDPDDDNDTVPDTDDEAPFDQNACRDVDDDTCDDCSSGTDDPANDGVDADGDGFCDAGDRDTDNDGVDDVDDDFPFDATQCRDADNDSCDDCASGTDAPDNDGDDFDGDGFCDAGDPDDDADGVADGSDDFPLDPTQCRDIDADGCDDCVSGVDNPAADGADADGDGLCNEGDPDDDNDTVLDGSDEQPRNPLACRDADMDLCDDCSSTVDDPANDGVDTDADGLCDRGDPDSDNDGIANDLDDAPLDRFVCTDADVDGCDDCSQAGETQPANDGTDTDTDGLCDLGDLDDDGDGVSDVDDDAPLDNSLCRDDDADGCNDCSSFTYDVASDGTDTDGDGACDLGDDDDDDDGVPDGDDDAPLDGTSCRDADADLCDDCSSGTDDPAADGTDTDGDGACDAGDGDDDNDGVLDPDDAEPLDNTACRDRDDDLCDDCSSGKEDASDDGADNDDDGLCDAGDPDDDNDAVDDADDDAPFDETACRDADGDGCDDCVSGSDDPADDGTDTDADGACDEGDDDDDNDGVADADDASPLTATACRDADGDGCDDCLSGADDPAADGTDTDADGLCDVGDTDDDADGVADADDNAPLTATACRDTDNDNCDDCSSGKDNPGDDGPDYDNDGQCDLGDPDGTIESGLGEMLGCGVGDDLGRRRSTGGAPVFLLLLSGAFAFGFLRRRRCA